MVCACRCPLRLSVPDRVSCVGEQEGLEVAEVVDYS